MPKCKNIPVLISLYKFAVRTGYPRQSRFLPQWTDNVKNIPKNNEKLSSKNKLTSYEILKKKKHGGPVRAALFHMDLMDKVIRPLTGKSYCVTYYSFSTLLSKQE